MILTVPGHVALPQMKGLWLRIRSESYAWSLQNSALDKLGISALLFTTRENHECSENQIDLGACAWISALPHRFSAGKKFGIRNKVAGLLTARGGHRSPFVHDKLGRQAWFSVFISGGRAIGRPRTTGLKSRSRRQKATGRHLTAELWHFLPSPLETTERVRLWSP